MADDGQPSQLPVMRSRTTPRALVDRDHLDVAAVRAEIGPHAGERLLDARREVVRVEPVHEQQARHQLVGGQPARDSPAAVRRRRRRCATMRPSPAP